MAKDPAYERHLDFAVDSIYPHIVILFDRLIVVKHLIGEPTTKSYVRLRSKSLVLSTHLFSVGS